jgi:hypothetical protein
MSETQNTDRNEDSMEKLIARYEEILKTRQATSATDACYMLMDEGASFDDAATAASKAFGGKPARRTRDSITTTAW